MAGMTDELFDKAVTEKSFAIPTSKSTKKADPNKQRPSDVTLP